MFDEFHLRISLSESFLRTSVFLKNWKMLKIFAFICMACVVLNSVHGSSFECGDEPASCKSKFGTQLVTEFRKMHLAGMRTLITTYVNKMTAVKADLSSDSPYLDAVENAINAAQKSLQEVLNSADNDEKYGEAVEEAMISMQLEIKEEDFKKLVESHEVRQSLIAVFRQMGVDVGNLWADMYKGLRDKDLKAYPEYADVNEFMKYLRGKGDRPAKGTDYTQAAEILADKFGLDFFQMVDALG